MRKHLLYVIFILVPAVLSAAEPDTLFNGLFRRDIGGWIAADATYSIYLPDGRTIWLFGDTFIGEVDENNAIVPGSAFIRNSAVLQDGDQMNTLYAGDRSSPSTWIPTANPDSTWYWPDHGIVDDDTFMIFLAKFRESKTAPDGFNFEHAGNDLASLTWPGLKLLACEPVAAHGLNGVLYGNRVLEEAPYLYIYGRRQDAPGINIVYPHLARCLQGELGKGEWEYFDGQGWSSDPMDTRRINDFQVSQQYSVSKYLGKYILLTQDIWLSPKIWTFTSETPYGPWSNKKLIYTTPESDEGMITYNAYAHPQFDRSGEMLVSYNTNGDFWSIFDNVELYRPRFIRVPYMVMDYDFWPNGLAQDRWDQALKVSLHPNPFAARAYIELSATGSGPLYVSVFDLNGRKVISCSPGEVLVGKTQMELDLTHLPNGVYICRVELDGAWQDIKMIKCDKK